MDEEFEAKFYPINKAEFRKRLKEIGATLVAPERKLRRVIFDYHANPQLKCDYIRIRDEGGIVRLSIKTHAREGGKIADQKEIDVEVNDFEKTIKIFESLGFVRNRYQETLREAWKYHETEIDIESWPGLEPYVEIESNSEERVKETSAKLGLDWRKGITRAVVEIYMAVYGLTSEEALEKLSNITFENNPFVGRKPKKLLDKKIFWGYNN